MFNFIGTLMIVVTILLCLVIALPRIAGINGYVVVSGSMEPKIPVGSIVYARKCEPSSVQKGEVIVFYDSLGNTVPVTHRVVENRSEQGEIITKGDANATEDFAPVRYENVIGRVIVHVPFLGKLVSPLSTVYGKLIYMGIVLLGFVLCEIGRNDKIKREG